ncbi:MAG: hypothetical protein QW112_00750 [Candidatus Micrarchaeia archaeon]
MIEEISNLNTEIRYITVELMKIAAKRKVSFESVAKEFLENAYLLHEMIGKEKKRLK